ncbi:MAG: carboxypeptidase-like regulatory domain-containing protein, partial [Acidobacteriota bacterium]
MLRRVLFVVALLVCAAAPAFARSSQVDRGGKLQVTVVDPSGGVIPNATVTVTGQDDPTRVVALAPAMTSATGIATFESLVPGRYTVQASFDAFQTITIKDVRVRAGDNRQKITLPLKNVDESLTVGRDKQSAALDPLGNSFST